MALTLGQAEEMEACAREAGTRIIVGYNCVHNPAATHVRGLVAYGRIGEVVHFRDQVDKDCQDDPDLN